MDGTCTYPYFPYLSTTHYKPPGYSGTLFYQDLLNRFWERTESVHNEWNHIEPCWYWTGNSQETLSHKYLGMIPVRLLAHALHTPADLNHLRKFQRKRFKFDSINRCDDRKCIRPDHLVLAGGDIHLNWLNKPIKRDPKKHRDDWLTYPETLYMTSQLHMGMSDPDVWLISFCERIALPYLTVSDVWLKLHTMIENQYKEYTL